MKDLEKSGTLLETCKHYWEKCRNSVITHIWSTAIVISEIVRKLVLKHSLEHDFSVNIQKGMVSMKYEKILSI